MCWGSNALVRWSIVCPNKSTAFWRFGRPRRALIADRSVRYSKQQHRTTSVSGFATLFANLNFTRLTRLNSCRYIFVFDLIRLAVNQNTVPAGSKFRIPVDTDSTQVANRNNPFSAGNKLLITGRSPPQHREKVVRKRLKTCVLGI